MFLIIKKIGKKKKSPNNQNQTPVAESLPRGRWEPRGLPTGSGSTVKLMRGPKRCHIHNPSLATQMVTICRACEQPPPPAGAGGILTADELLQMDGPGTQGLILTVLWSSLSVDSCAPGGTSRCTAQRTRRGWVERGSESSHPPSLDVLHRNCPLGSSHHTRSEGGDTFLRPPPCRRLMLSVVTAAVAASHC